MAKDKELLQWHPAFFAGLQIELQEDADHLAFLNEYQLGTKPKQIDVLVIKKRGKLHGKEKFRKIFSKIQHFRIQKSNRLSEYRRFLHRICVCMPL